MDGELLIRNGVQVGEPAYQIIGENFPLNSSVELHIISKYPAPIKISAILRKHLNLSQKALKQALDAEIIRSDSVKNFQKSKLQKSNKIVVG